MTKFIELKDVNSLKMIYFCLEILHQGSYNHNRFYIIYYMLERNKIYQMDVLDGLKNLDDNGDVNVDNMPEDKYEQWQIEILNECFRVLKDDGSMFYNHKLRVHKNKASFPLEWINAAIYLLPNIFSG